MKTLKADTFVARQLAWLTRLIYRRPGWFIYPQILLCIACAFYTYFFLGFDSNRENLVGADKKHHRDFIAYKREFRQQDDIVVVVESEDGEKNRQFERLGTILEKDTNFTDVFYKGDLKMMGSKALLFVPEDDLKGLKKTLGEFRPFIKKFAQTTNLVTLFDMVNTQFRTSGREKNAQTDSLINALPALERIISQAEACLNRPGVPPSPGVTALFNAGKQAQQQMYITFKDGTMYLVSAHAPSAKMNEPAVKRLRILVEQVRREVPGVNAAVTGSPVLDYDEMVQSQKDMTLASIVSLILCAMIFIYGYQQTGRPIKATICLVVGLTYTMAFATFAIGSLNILTVTFMPMLIGLAIDFGVHLVTRYEEELRNGRSEEESLNKAMVFTGRGIFLGALTTAGAFLAMGLTDFKGIQQMGLICGAGLMICLVPMMTMLPALLLRGKQNVLDHKSASQAKTRARIEGLWLKRPVIVTVITLTLCGLAATQLHKIYFDYNLLNMQSDGLPSVEFEKKLIDSSSRSVLYGVVVADTLDEAVSMEAKLRELPVVSEVDSMSKFLSENQTGKLVLIGEIKQELADINFAAPDPAPVRMSELSRTLYSFYGYLGAAFQAVEKQEPELAKKLASLREAVEGLRKKMLDGSPSQVEAHAAKLGSFQRALFNDLSETFQVLRTQDNSDRLHIEDLPKPLRERFVGATGKHLLQVYPKGNLWQREVQKEFIDEVTKVYPSLTGTPVQLYEYTNLLKESYQQAALYALAAIAVMVLIHFRSFLSVILALLPVLIGTLWMMGLMGLFKIPFNPANIMTLPLVIGIGVTNGIHILNRFAEERHASILAKSTGKAVLVSGLTAIAGFGSLILAKHRGIQSLGDMMSTGITTCMIAGLTFLPALLTLLMRQGSATKQPSVDNAQSTLGREEPR